MKKFKELKKFKNILKILIPVLVCILWVSHGKFSSPSVTASASNSFIPRTTAPHWGSTRFYPRNHYWFPWINGNCTAYAYARGSEIIHGTLPTQFKRGNAKDWMNTNIRYNLYPHGSTPRVGAIAVYGPNAAHKFGHVAIVEKIVNGNVYLSESGYRGPSFRYGKHYATNSPINYSGLPVIGYIYLR